jgi:phosphoribosylformylglycinamidine synthase PurS subunit
MKKARVQVTYKKGVLDPEGQTVMQSLTSLGFKGIEDVRIGKYIEIDFSSNQNEQNDIENIRSRNHQKYRRIILRILNGFCGNRFSWF